MSVVLHEFRSKRILVVEAGDTLTDDLRQQLTPHGATVLGPMPSVGAAIALIQIGSLDAAILDIELDSETAFSIAEVLEERAIPFVFVSYDAVGTKYAGFQLGQPSSLQTIGLALFRSTSH